MSIFNGGIRNLHSPLFSRFHRLETIKSHGILFIKINDIINRRNRNTGYFMKFFYQCKYRLVSLLQTKVEVTLGK